MELKTERLILKPLSEDLIEWVRQQRNRYHDKFFDGGYITKEQQRIFFDKYRESSVDRMFVICLKNGEKIGTIAVYNISISDRTADIGRILLIDDYRGHGYMSEALKCILEMAFEDLRLWKIKVATHLDNLDALNIYAKLGFKTTTRPVILLEKENININWKKPVKVASYDAISDTGYESQETNAK